MSETKKPRKRGPAMASMWVAKDPDGIIVETAPTVPGLVALLAAEHGSGRQYPDGRDLVFRTYSGKKFLIDAWCGRVEETPRPASAMGRAMHDGDDPEQAESLSRLRGGECPTCGGSGRAFPCRDSEECAACGGSGFRR